MSVITQSKTKILLDESILGIKTYQKIGFSLKQRMLLVTLKLKHLLIIFYLLIIKNDILFTNNKTRVNHSIKLY